MTLRNGDYITGGAGELLPSSSETARGRFNPGEIILQPTGTFNITLYKNEGWYATGSLYEEWITATAPSTTPPSGHTLTFIQYFPLQV